jgi:hypothetical protein
MVDQCTKHLSRTALRFVAASPLFYKSLNSSNLIDIIVGEFAPLVTYVSTQLLPVDLNALRQELSFTSGSPFARVACTCYACLCFSLPPLMGWVVTYVTSYKRVHRERERKREKETVLCA